MPIAWTFRCGFIASKSEIIRCCVIHTMEERQQKYNRIPRPILRLIHRGRGVHYAKYKYINTLIFNKKCFLKTTKKNTTSTNASNSTRIKPVINSYGFWSWRTLPWVPDNRFNGELLHVLELGTISQSAWKNLFLVWLLLIYIKLTVDQVRRRNGILVNLAKGLFEWMNLGSPRAHALFK